MGAAVDDVEARNRQGKLLSVARQVGKMLVPHFVFHATSLLYTAP